MTPRRDDAIDRAFEAFHAANPHVMDELVRLTRELHARDVRRVGMGMLFEVMRWSALRTAGDPFRLNNNYRSRYARRLMDDHPDLAGIFDTRELRPPVPRPLSAP